MSTADARREMDAALKRVVVTELRSRGFTGSQPHFRRRSSECIALLTIQYFSAGGSFVVEVATCAPDGFTTSWGDHVEPSRVTAHDIDPNQRPRLGTKFPEGGEWFVFGPRTYDRQKRVKSARYYDRVAAKVLRLIDAQAEPFWQDECARLAAD